MCIYCEITDSVTKRMEALMTMMLHLFVSALFLAFVYVLKSDHVYTLCVSLFSEKNATGIIFILIKLRAKAMLHLLPW